MDTEYSFSPISPPARNLAPQAWARWDAKTKPQLSLGRLEQLAVDIVCMRRELVPRLGRPLLLVFGADHGIVDEHVTGSPRQITWQQCKNIAKGGGAIGLMCKHNGIDMQVVDVGVAYDFEPADSIISCKVDYGTQNFAKTAAMERQQCLAAMATGQRLVGEAADAERAVIAFGEMGIGNTTSAAALMAAITGCDVELCTGIGSGMNEQQLEHKRSVIKDALMLHGRPADPIETLRTYGGYEIAAITGGLLEAASRRMVILMDGFITSVALLVARAIDPAVMEYVVFCHESRETGHRLLLAYLGASPLLRLSLCLGEGTGAALGWLLVRQAMDLYCDMTSFNDAQVTDSVTLLKQRGVDLHAR